MNRAICVTLLALSMIQADAHRMRPTIAADTLDNTQIAGCSPSTCTGFEKNRSCSCDTFVGSPELLKRAKVLLYNVAQSMRYLSDYQANASIWQGLWSFNKNAKIFGGSLSDMEFLSGAMELLPNISALVNVPVGDVSDEFGFQAPAGTMPIMVEIWDKDYLTNEFVGEAGVPLTIGSHSYNLPLRSNPSRSKKTHDMALKGKPLGSVAFDIAFAIEGDNPPRTCADDANTYCADAVVTVTCKSASNLVNTDTFSKTDPYCKVRMKQDESRPSTKDVTPHISNELNPTWVTSNSFSHRWEVELLSVEKGPDVAFVPLTLERLTIVEQFVSNLHFYIQVKFLGGKKCQDIGAKSASQEKLCDMLKQLEDHGVTEALVDEVAADTKNEQLKNGLKQLDDRIEGEVSGDSLVELSEEGAEEGPHFAAVHSAVRRRRRPAGGGYGGGRRYGGGGGGGDGGGAGWGAAILLLLFIVLLPIGL